MRMAGETVGFGSFSEAIEQRGPQAIAEALADAYLDGAENSDNETRVEALQELAKNAISRLAWLRSLA
jgi:hypothetical protein